MPLVHHCTAFAALGGGREPSFSGRIATPTRASSYQVSARPTGIGDGQQIFADLFSAMFAFELDHNIVTTAVLANCCNKSLHSTHDCFKDRSLGQPARWPRAALPVAELPTAAQKMIDRFVRHRAMSAEAARLRR